MQSLPTFLLIRLNFVVLQHIQVDASLSGTQVAVYSYVKEVVS